MNVAIRALSEGLHPTVIVALRTVLTLVLLVPFIARRGGRVLETRHFRLHLMRGVVDGIGMID